MTHTYACRLNPNKCFLFFFFGLSSLAEQGLPLARNDFLFFFLMSKGVQ